MKRLYSLVAVLALLLLVTSCSKLFGPKPPEPGMVRQIIENIGNQFEIAVQQGDSAAIAMLYAEDAKLLPPEASMSSGRHEIQAFWQGFIESTVSRELNLQVLQIDYDGHIASEMGTYQFQFQPKGPGAQTITEIGKYVTIWKRQTDGSWKIIVDTWNTNLSPPASP